ncbi:MAG: S41 family peptidase [Vampirovibrionales bacterium]
MPPVLTPSPLTPSSTPRGFAWRWQSAARQLRLLYWMMALSLLAFMGGMLLGYSNAIPWLSHWFTGNSPQAQAQALLTEAWQYARLEFRDPTMNHQRWQQWRDRYHRKLQSPADAHVAIATMLTSLNDEYTRFLPPNEMQEQTMQINAELFGVGVQIGLRNNTPLNTLRSKPRFENKQQPPEPTIVLVLPNSPAQRAGLHVNEVITHINGVSTQTYSLQEVADHIRGPLNTPVTLTLRAPNRHQRTLTLKRAAVHLQSVTVENDTPPSIGHIHLSSFLSETMMAELEEALTQLHDKKALIIDVRGNFGGLVDNAVAIADRFLTQGNIVTVEGMTTSAFKTSLAKWIPTSRLGYKSQETLKAKATANDVTLPVVILMDGASASASEILCGALKDNHRATLMGTTTFGKGLVQKIVPLSDGSGMNISVARYLTPLGYDIHKKGIEPDIRVLPQATARSHDPQLAAAITYLQQQLKRPPATSPTR